jgi:WD40 repeat protein
MQGGHCLVSSGLDRKVYVWDTEQLEYSSAKIGNSATIKALSFDSADNILVGAGFEGVIFCWGESLTVTSAITVTTVD